VAVDVELLRSHFGFDPHHFTRLERKMNPPSEESRDHATPPASVGGTTSSRPETLPGSLSLGTWSLIAAASQFLIGAAFLARYSKWMAGPHTNIDLYLSFANRTLGGEIPYRDFDVEYPIFALPLMIVPRLFAKGLGGYLVAFSIEMALINALTVSMVGRKILRDGGHLLGGLAWYTLFIALLCPLIFTRYDLAPTMLGFAAACLWSSGWHSWGGLAAGVGVLMKVFPGACVLPAVVREASTIRRTHLRGTLSLVGITIVGLVTWMIVGGPGFFNSLKYHTSRGIEIGSIYSGLVIMLEKAAGSRPEILFNFGAYHLSGAWADRLTPLIFPIQMVSIATVILMYKRSNYADELRYAAASLLAFAIMGKVLSPQYLIWLIPFMASLGGRIGRLARPLFAASCFATSLIYPVYFDALILLRDGPVVLLLIRNALMLSLLALLTFGPTSRAAARGADATPSPSSG
jgi:hypothetical protein